ncbi:CBS domain-containing protein [Aggregicoccus sp. 17bor-14]|uniref:CBS domain-containing protein n=1 Tax=Myxococcaceae TaxID=31 RepID=UPI00129CB82B|nr:MULTISPECIES: CBS domain-containing protein [Myxococcaceae]MBF5045734.1 CBS domain-containing protein [Simulacricoccus sp. 17bor-14]MRI91470.1 CBS domain-containing protein [Aggregicoccus sp. 17bor-14]
MLQVQDLMTRDVITLRPMENLRRVEALLRRGRVRHLPVVDGGRLVGLVTHRDLLAALARGGGAATEPAVWAIDAMTRDVRTVRPETSLREALELMLKNKFGCLPVVDAAGSLVGIVTESDLVRFCGELVVGLDRRSEAAEYEC